MRKISINDLFMELNKKEIKVNKEIEKDDELTRNLNVNTHGHLITGLISAF